MKKQNPTALIFLAENRAIASRVEVLTRAAGQELVEALAQSREQPAELQVSAGAAESQGAAGPFCMHTKEQTTSVARFILLNFMYKSRFQIKHLM